MASAKAPNITKRKFMAKPTHISSRARRNPHTSQTQSLMMYDTGNTSKPPVIVTGPKAICFVSSTFAVIRQTQNSMPNSMNSTLTCSLFLFIPCFIDGG